MYNTFAITPMCCLKTFPPSILENSWETRSKISSESSFSDGRPIGKWNLGIFALGITDFNCLLELSFFLVRLSFVEVDKVSRFWDTLLLWTFMFAFSFSCSLSRISLRTLSLSLLMEPFVKLWNKKMKRVIYLVHIIIHRIIRMIEWNELYSS